MEAFEKWKNNRSGNSYMVNHGAELGWKAALEWVLKQLDYSSEHKEIEDVIYKELNNE